MCRIEQGSIAASLYDKLADRETIRSMIQSWGYRITRQLVLHLSEEEHVLIDKMNKDWNPELFANGDLQIKVKPQFSEFTNNSQDKKWHDKKAASNLKKEAA